MTIGNGQLKIFNEKPVESNFHPFPADKTLINKDIGFYNLCQFKLFGLKILRMSSRILLKFYAIR